jgi:hypothetical protein
MLRSWWQCPERLGMHTVTRKQAQQVLSVCWVCVDREPERLGMHTVMRKQAQQVLSVCWVCVDREPWALRHPCSFQQAWLCCTCVPFKVWPFSCKCFAHSIGTSPPGLGNAHLCTRAPGTSVALACTWWLHSRHTFGVPCPRNRQLTDECAHGAGLSHGTVVCKLVTLLPVSPCQLSHRLTRNSVGPR